MDGAVRVALFLAVISRLVQLQIVGGAEYAAMAHENIIRRVTLADDAGSDSRHRRQGSRIEPHRIQRLSRSRARHAERSPGSHARPSGAPARPGLVAKLAECFGSIRKSDVPSTSRFARRARPTMTSLRVGARPYSYAKTSRDTVAELKQHDAELVGSDVAPPRSASTRRGAGAHCSATWPRSTPRRSARFVRPASTGLPRDAQQTVESDRLRVGRHDGGDRSRARVGVVPERPTRVGETRGRRSGALSVRPRHGAFSRRDARQDPVPGRESASRSTSSSNRRSSERCDHSGRRRRRPRSGNGRILAMYSKPSSIRTTSPAEQVATASAETLSRLY